MNRQNVYDALFQLGAAITWAEEPAGFVTKDKRLKDFADDQGQPSFYQVGHDEFFEQKAGLPYRVRLTAKWVVHYKVDPGEAGSVEGDHIMDAFENALSPKPVSGQQYVDRCTLGGLAYHVFIDGRVFRDGGDLDGQGVIVVPISILVP